jgi:hypothetical protein
MVVDELNAFDDFLMIKLDIGLGTGEANFIQLNIRNSAMILDQILPQDLHNPIDVFPVSQPCHHLPFCLYFQIVIIERRVIFLPLDLVQVKFVDSRGNDLPLFKSCHFF